MQIGHFNNSQAAERATLVGDDPRRATLATIANYCNIQGKLDEFQTITSRLFSTEQLQSLLVLAEG